MHKEKENANFPKWWVVMLLLVTFLVYKIVSRAYTYAHKLKFAMCQKFWDKNFGEPNTTRKKNLGGRNIKLLEHDLTLLLFYI